ncbi:MAG TPA: hypothetical protein VJ828_13215 [Lacipirellulaceae bacterium]|nr:hypothetical protein [Lacipirellulaceae bacterium]
MPQAPMRDTDSGLADASIDAVDRVFETLGNVAGTGHPAADLAGCRVRVA